jgi:hypothetical protein
LAQANTILGAATAQQGRYEEGIAQMEQALAGVHSKGPRLSYLPLLVQAYIAAGRPDDGQAVLGEMLAAAHEHRNPPSESAAYRLKGELLLRQNYSNAPEAEKCFRHAVEIARGQSHKVNELRATTGLAQLLVLQGRRDEARMMLAEIYNWFTEGFDTVDLKDAKALLEELGG